MGRSVGYPRSRVMSTFCCSAFRIRGIAASQTT
jgi:hypothetical protein